MKLAEIIDLLKPVAFQGDVNHDIAEAKSVDDPHFGKNSIGWCADKNIHLIREKSAGSVLVSKAVFEEVSSQSDLNFIVVGNPRKAFAAMLDFFFIRKPAFGTVDLSANIHVSATLDPEKVIIGSNVVIEEHCVIGNHVIIDHNTVIKSGTVIHDHVKIGANCTIGGVGFGYEPNEDGIYEVIPHIGNVVLHEHVEIGNNVCIDRAVMGSTTLYQHAKVDNLVHIAHGVVVGKNSLVIANAMIAGSVQIGENCWIAPSSSIKQKATVGDNSLVGMGSVVLKNVEANTTVAGVPAKKMEKN